MRRDYYLCKAFDGIGLECGSLSLQLHYFYHGLENEGR